MGVPAHDQRDFDFASKFSLEIIQVISDSPDREQELNAAFTEDGTLINSAQFNGQDTKTAISKITAYLDNEKIGKSKTQYRMRDWLISRPVSYTHLTLPTKA